MQKFITQQLYLIIEKYPLHSFLNPKILKEMEDISFNMSYKTNVKAQMSDWYITTPSLEVIKKLVCDILLKYEPSLSNYRLFFPDCWISSYNKGEFAEFHDHALTPYSFVYFVKCPKGSSPLLVGDRKKRIKAEEGKIVIFPGCLWHGVPKNKCDGRVVVAGNVALDETERIKAINKLTE